MKNVTSCWAGGFVGYFVILLFCYFVKHFSGNGLQMKQSGGSGWGTYVKEQLLYPWMEKGQQGHRGQRHGGQLSGWLLPSVFGCQGPNSTLI
jgi:hypothetical protein